MTRTKKIIIWILAAAINIWGIGYLGYGNHTLKQGNNTLRHELDKSEAKADLLKKKYSTERALAEGMLRTKQLAESRIAALQTDIAGLETEKSKLAVQIESLNARIEENKTRYSEVIEQHKERFATLKTQYLELQEKSRKELLERNDTIAELTERKAILQSSLNREEHLHKRCRRNNNALADLGEELIEQYKNKGVVKAITTTEPFTGRKMVELEQLVQEYRDVIDRERLEQ
ncbi:MAG: hypothetical protein KKG47_09540 [Proteobacteria bacterium]|nr:hypothetical protein [Pseudomonadota bacterium]MBU1736860.1 hypothetical protein [Pseudomonadota bacterium]